eukprot:jgi/Hompol1/4745/HPOL_000502-RA
MSVIAVVLAAAVMPVHAADPQTAAYSSLHQPLWPRQQQQQQLSSGSEQPINKRPNLGILVPLATFAAVGLVCLLLFCIVRTCFKDIYSPRRVLTRSLSLYYGRPPRLRKGLFSWIPVVYSTKETFLINTVGLDGVMVLQPNRL